MRRIIQTFSNFGFASKSIYSILFILTFAFTAQAQSFVKGIISDAGDNVPLPAATVLIKGTTNGTITDANGEYVLRLTPGTHLIEFSYLGFDTQEQEITIDKDETVELNIKLALSSFTGEEVVITAQARGQLAAVNQQLRSNQIMNVVSAEKIRELPDENAAQAISRLPGVHLDGSKVVIRGVEPKMNKIMINGVEMPSTERDSRATDLGMISANMLSGIEVVKTLTPDMDADAVGGVVNMRLREASEGLHFSLTSQNTYNQQEEYMSKYMVWGDVSNRFLDNRLGVILNVNVDKRQDGDDWYSKGYEAITGTDSELGEGLYRYVNLNVYDDYDVSTNFGGSLVIDFDLPNGQIIYSGMLSSSTPDETQYTDNMNWGGQSANYRRIHLDRAKYNRDLMNHTLRFEQNFGIFDFDASISNVAVQHEDDYRYRARFAESGSISAFDIINTEIGDANYLLTMPTWEIYDYQNEGFLDNMRINDMNFTDRTYSEEQWLGDFNVKVPLNISDKIDIELKAGGKYKKKDRNYDELSLTYYNNNVQEVNQSVADWLMETVGHAPGDGTLYFRDFRDYGYTPNGEYMSGNGARLDAVVDADLMDDLMLNQIDLNLTTTPMDQTVDMVRNDYWGWETYTAGYLMGTINIGNRLTLIPGVRYEKVHKEYTAPKVEYRTMNIYPVHDTLTRPVDNENFLPHFHVRFKATDWWDIRFSYNNTLTRPDYRYAIPYVFYNTSDATGVAGNPYLKPAESENIDGNFTFYSRKLGLFTIGGFYKTLSNVFYSQPTILRNLPDSTILAEFPIDQYTSLGAGTTTFYINSGHKANIKGLEVEWQSNLSWLPSPFNGLVFNANYTHVWSETKYDQHREKNVILPYPPYFGKEEDDTTYTNRLLQQADDIANVSVGYDYKGFSARISFRYQGNVVSDIATRSELNEYTKPIYKYDLVVKQQIPIKSADFEIFLNAINFTNVPTGRYIDYPNRGKSTTYQRYSGRQFQLGLRLKY